MATVIRIKRRHDEEPTENIIVKAKRSRIEPEEDGAAAACEASVDAVMTRVGTVDSKEDDIQKHVLKGMKEYKKGWELREQYKKLGNLLKHKQTKKDIKDNSSKKRYKIVATYRGLKDNPDKEEESLPEEKDSQGESAEDKKDTGTDGDNSLMSGVFNLYDATLPETNPIDDVITCNGVPMESVKYVYDIYYTSQPVDCIEHIFEIEKHTQLYCGSDSDDDSHLEDDDDENEEGNWRNDYPDESDDSHYSDEMEYLNAQIKKVTTRNYGSDESYDVDDYEEQFDEDGNLVTCGYPYAGDSFRSRIRELSSSDESDED